MIKNFLNLEGHQNPLSGSKVTAILLKGWIWPIGGASAGEGLPCSLRRRLVLPIITPNGSVLKITNKVHTSAFRLNVR